MRISELLKRDGVTFSLEVFPPKTSEKYSETAAKAMEIARLKPDFMSVTYGAGGGTGPFTAGIAEEIQKEYGMMIYLVMRDELSVLAERSLKVQKGDILITRSDKIVKPVD